MTKHCVFLLIIISIKVYLIPNKIPMLITIVQSPFSQGWSFEMKLASTYSDEIICKIMCHLP